MLRFFWLIVSVGMAMACRGDSVDESCGDVNTVIPQAAPPGTDVTGSNEGVRYKKAEWSIVAYIQADNDLSPFAEYNIRDMQSVSLPESVNMLIQWDKPNSKKTWRYRIVKGGRIEDASLATAMGVDPVGELVDMMEWAKGKYDAKRWCVILWNHGYGVVDPRFFDINKVFKSAHVALSQKPIVPWLQIPGLKIQKSVPEKDRGILFDETENTYATNQDLTLAFAGIEKVLGKKVDIVGMDACLMAMLEVGYQIKDHADILVGSQNTEPSEGWSYSGFLKKLSYFPSMVSPASLASAIVQSYHKFYKEFADDYTQSAMDLSKLEAIRKNIDQVVSAVFECSKIDYKRIRSDVRMARKSAVEFYVADYIDLYSFYSALSEKIKMPRNARCVAGHKAALRADDASYIRATQKLNTVLLEGMIKIKDAVIDNVVGADFSLARGISIYYPAGDIHESYPDTLFAQSSRWIDLIKNF